MTRRKTRGSMRVRGLAALLEVAGLRGLPGLAVPGALAVLSGLAGPSSAQVAPATPPSSPGTEVGLYGAGFVDYPEELSNDGCQYGVAGLGGEGRFWALRWLGLEGGALLTFHAGSTRCDDVLSLPIPIDVPFMRTVYDDQLGESPALDTSVGAVLEPLRGSLVSPRLRVGVGKDWSKGFSFWYGGAGVRFPLGHTHAVLLDLERRTFDLERVHQTVIVRSDGSVDVLASESETIERAPWLVRVGWSWGLGGR